LLELRRQQHLSYRGLAEARESARV